MIFGIMTSSLLFHLSGGRFTFLKVSVLEQKVLYSHVPCALPALPFSDCYVREKFFGHPKNHQKIDSSKNMFLDRFSIFSRFVRLILSHFGTIWGPPGHQFSMFFGDTSFALFFGYFFTNSKKWNAKSAQNTAPVHRFRGSPG